MGAGAGKGQVECGSQVQGQVRHKVKVRVRVMIRAKCKIRVKAKFKVTVMSMWAGSESLWTCWHPSSRQFPYPMRVGRLRVGDERSVGVEFGSDHPSGRRFPCLSMLETRQMCPT